MNLMEDLLAVHLAELRLPFERQFEYMPGRKFRADFGLPKYGLLIEVQGGVFSRQAHGSITGVLADLERGNMAAISGYRVLRFTPDQVKRGEAKDVIAWATGRRRDEWRI